MSGVSSLAGDRQANFTEARPLGVRKGILLTQSPGSPQEAPDPIKERGGPGEEVAPGLSLQHVQEADG